MYIFQSNILINKIADTEQIFSDTLPAAAAGAATAAAGAGSQAHVLKLNP